MSSKTYTTIYDVEPFHATIGDRHVTFVRSLSSEFELSIQGNRDRTTAEAVDLILAALAFMAGDEDLTWLKQVLDTDGIAKLLNDVQKELKSAVPTIGASASSSPPGNAGGIGAVAPV